MKMTQHFVVFLSPGTFVPEESKREIASWNVDLAIEMAQGIMARYDSRPFGFQFVTHSRDDHELDSHETTRSNMYYLGGRVFTLAEIQARNDPKEKILLLNMKSNGVTRVIENTNSWKFVGEFKEGDVLLDVTLKKDQV